MLSLTRHLYESVIIETNDGPIVVKITRITLRNPLNNKLLYKPQVMLSIEAPDNCNIYRSELVQLHNIT